MRGPFNDLHAFTIVARLRSFTRAAAQLNVSQSALSQTIRALEETMGLQLLARSTRSVAPTEAGARLLARLGPQFDDMQAALNELGELSDTPRGTVRINAGEHPILMVLAPQLEGFLAAYPDIQVEIAIDAGMIDIVAEGFDAGVRLGEQVALDMVAVRISADIRMSVVGSPAYLGANPAPRDPQDLAAHRCINMRMPTHGEVFPWELQKDGREIRVRVEGPLTINSLPLRLKAALSGIGLAYLPHDQTAPHLASGRLMPVLQDWWPVFQGYHLYYPGRRQASPAFRLLVDWLRERP